MNPRRRKAGRRALKDLAKDQDKLIERGREILQKITREKPDVAKDARAALDKMGAARDDLENGRDANREQAEAVDKLDTARDKLDMAAAQAGRQLSDEKRRKLADQVKRAPGAEESGRYGGDPHSRGSREGKGLGQGGS